MATKPWPRTRPHFRRIVCWSPSREEMEKLVTAYTNKEFDCHLSLGSYLSLNSGIELSAKHETTLFNLIKDRFFELCLLEKGLK